MSAAVSFAITAAWTRRPLRTQRGESPQRHSHLKAGATAIQLSCDLLRAPGEERGPRA